MAATTTVADRPDDRAALISLASTERRSLSAEVRERLARLGVEVSEGQTRTE
jgi:hypothetical protein